MARQIRSSTCNLHAPECGCRQQRDEQLKRRASRGLPDAAAAVPRLAPTHIVGVSPLSGETTGGYELHIKGSELWASEDLTVRFIPLTGGRLRRGSLRVYNKATQEAVCQVPKFSLAGEFAVEVAMNGKHFTTNGHTFSAFKRPLITQVSIYESRLEGGEDAFIVLEGNLPTKNGQEPIIRFIPCTSGQQLLATKTNFSSSQKWARWMSLKP